MRTGEKKEGRIKEFSEVFLDTTVWISSDVPPAGIGVVCTRLWLPESF